MADYPGGPKGLKPSHDEPKNTNYSGPAVPVVQPCPGTFCSSQTPEEKTKTTPVVKSKKP